VKCENEAMYRLTEKHFVIVLILPEKDFGDSWGAILETGNSKLGKEMRIQVVIKFQVSNFQFLGVTQGKSLRKSHIKSPKNIFLKAIVGLVSSLGTGSCRKLG